MKRRTFLQQGGFYGFLFAARRLHCLADSGPEIEQGTPDLPPIAETHFPDRLHLFIWRNWELANADRMAQVLGTTQEKVLEIGYSMGLPSKPHLTEDQLRRIYITVVRQNWHVLSAEQLMELLGWDREKYEYHLAEDDFLWLKLGQLKPACATLRYEEPMTEVRERSAKIKQLVTETFGSSRGDAGEPPFQFVADLSSSAAPRLSGVRRKLGPGEVDLSRGWTLRQSTQESSDLSEVMHDFQAYLRTAYGCEVASGTMTPGNSKVLDVSVNSSMTGRAGSFLASVETNKITLVGRDLGGVRQAFYYLQDQMEDRQAPYVSSGDIQRVANADPRFVYSYFALYGDPLIEPNVDSLPDGFLERLARVGINGVWLQGVLRSLAPSQVFPEFGVGSETRLQNLKKLVDRAQRYGVSIYLYLNEPRAMPEEFFARHPEIKGTYDADSPNFHAMCTSTPQVRQWLSESLAYIFAKVPGLGGIFCITASENLTNCYAHGHAEHCPRCSQRDGSEVIAEVIRTFRDGVRHSSEKAEVIAWDWGWGVDWVRNGATIYDVNSLSNARYPDPSRIIRSLPDDVAVMSVSEWADPMDRGGFPTTVGEYSISVVGPGPRATKNWDLAKQHGLRALAKVQWSSTWEISAVPYIPVPNLIAEHCERLTRADIQGFLTSWTVGGYPSPNCEVAKEYYFSNPPESGQVLRNLAVRRYGPEAAPHILAAWKAFSTAFVEYPMEGGALVYHIPTQHGPSNLLRLHPTGYKATMMLFPYDDYTKWVGRYPVRTVQQQFEKMAELWKIGLDNFRQALPLVEEHKKKMGHSDFGIAETCYLHFQSVANQISFYLLRDEWKQAEPSARPMIAARMAKLTQAEVELAKRQFPIARDDSMIGYEASNHYYYRPLDLIEKVLNCNRIIDELHRSQTSS
jgi:hypothetical protein